MQTFLDEFSAVSKTEWIKKIQQDLKGKPLDSIHFEEEIEGLSYKAYVHKSEVISANDSSVQRGLRPSNDWEVVSVVPKGDAEQMNKTALHYLMTGTTHLKIDFDDCSAEDCAALIKGIQFEHISTTLIYHTTEQLNALLPSLSSSIKKHTLLPAHSDLPKIKESKNTLIDGTLVQRTGGNTAQEIAYVLHEGHQQLYESLTAGHSIDASLTQLKFKFGIGSNYLINSIKFRVFRLLWNKIVRQYGTYSIHPFIEAEVGHLNKSLKDPHTNLLRQTTEAMSAVVGGVQELTILPYNWRSVEKETTKTQRLATNISLILKEESYLNAVIDPSGGAYVLEKLTEELATKSWSFLQQMESHNVPLSFIKESIFATKNLRMARFKNGTTPFIGINTYENPNISQKETWDSPIALNLGEEFIIERDCL